jgi:amino-acid N-acetyltransferase
MMNAAPNVEIMTMSSTSFDDAPRVRRADPADLAAIERLLTASSLPFDGVSDALEGFVVAQSGDAIVGVAGLEVCCDNALLRSVAVSPEWRSHGLGRALVTRLISDAEARGLRALYLLTTTAERYFPNFGFQRIARDDVPEDIRETVEFQSACPASATVMCRVCATSAAPVAG